jgi:two-component system alkaline phosphatase synthesis response regulator PhoP
VLLVDDEPALLTALSFLLEDAGHQVQSARDVQTALEVMRSRRPDAIVCDLRLPDVDGFEFYRQLQQHPDWQSIPFILLTGALDEVGRYRSASPGITRCLCKPFDPEDLLAVLKSDGRVAQQGSAGREGWSGPAPHEA